MDESGERVDVPASLLSVEALGQARTMPWKAGNEARRWLTMPLAWWSLRGVELGGGWRCYGLPVIQRHRESVIRIGRGMELRSTVRSNPLGPNHAVIISARQAGAELIIGEDFGMTGGSIVCDARIRIGNRVWVGANAVITDTDFHPLNPQDRRENPLGANTSPVRIGDDVFIGMGAMVLKGVSVGEGAVVGAASVVTRDVPPGCLAAGNPARVIRALG